METKIPLKDAVNFLENTCGVTEPLKKYSMDPVELLTEVSKAFLQTIPFQNLTLLSQNKQDRHVPTEEEIKLEVVNKRGGLCFTLNIFMHSILEAVGYDVDLTLACVVDQELAIGDHVIVLVKNMTADNSLHVVDVGFGFPSFEPVSLDFEDQANVKIYKHSFTTYKYIKESNKYFRLHQRFSGDVVSPGSSFEEPFQQKEWTRYYCFQNSPCKYGDEDVRRSAAAIYNWPSECHFQRMLRMVRWNDGKAIGIKGSTLLKENDHGKLEATEMTSTEEIKNRIMEYFPVYSESEIEAALRNLKLQKRK